MATDIEEVGFTGTAVNEGLLRDRGAGSVISDQRNVMRVGGTGPGKTHSTSVQDAR